MFWRKRPDHLAVYCDGAIGTGGRGSGVGVVVRACAPGRAGNGGGEIIGLVKRALPPMTNNEAEYAALALALQSARRFRPRALTVYMDSKVVVGQMQGHYAVRSPALKRCHAEACRLARRFQQVTYVHIPRDSNRLADALAGEALMEGSHVHSSEL